MLLQVINNLACWIVSGLAGMTVVRGPLSLGCSFYRGSAALTGFITAFVNQ